MHKLFTNPEHSSICQKIRKFAPECLKVIEEEVAKLIKVNIIKEAHYPEWLANVVIAPKKGGSGECALTSSTSTRRAPKIVFPCKKLI